MCRNRRASSTKKVYYVFNGGEQSFRICTIKNNMVHLIFLFKYSFQSQGGGRSIEKMSIGNSTSLDSNRLLVEKVQEVSVLRDGVF
jgi:hypothetical protein